MSETGTALERGINREAAGAITIAPHAGGMAAFAIQPRSMGEVMEFAKMLAISGPCIPKDFRNNPGSCLAIVMQALKWGADPYAVANKAFVVNDRVAYEAQLINAIVNSSTMLSKRLDCVFEGDGAKRRCRVVGYIKGEAEAREYLSPEVGAIPVKNSPLWKSDPDQQLYYYASRAWARRWVPEVLLGIYVPDELTPVVELHPVEARGQSQLELFEERHAPNAVHDFDPDTGEVLEPATPDPVWLAEWAALVPKPTGDGDRMDWLTFAEACCYLLSKASRADLEAIELHKSLHLRRMREEEPDLYRMITGGLSGRARELAGGGQ